MNEEIIRNRKKYLERSALYRSFGYDLEKERGFVLEQGRPFGGRILEAGTGKGHFALMLAREGVHFVTFDISADEQRFARLNLAHSGLDKQVDFRIEDGESLSFDDGSFDTIFSVNLIHHLSSPYKVMDELVRVLAKGGKLIMSDFTEEGFLLIDKVHAAEGGSHDTGNTGPEEIETYLKDKGFACRNTRSAYQWVIVAPKETV